MARRHRILALSAIAAAGFALSVLFSSVISRRTANGGLRRQMLVQLDAFQDPKTVHLRPNMEGLLRSDVPPMPLDMNGAPIGGAENEMPAAGGHLWNAPTSIGNAAMQPPPSMLQAEADAPPIPMPMDGAQPIFNNNNNAPIPMESSVEQPPVEDAGVRTTYNIDHALATVQAFRYTLFFFVYDAASDSFVVVHNIRGCDHGCNRIHRVAAVVSHALRKNFPGRFTQEKGDWVVMMSTGDAPRIKAPCLLATNNYCHSVDFAPILNFGSVFTNQNFLPSMVAMPLPVRPHIPCFEEWQSGGMEANRVCQDLQPKLDFGDNDVKTGLVFGQELGMLQSDNYWDDLVPQIIWRGTDFVFLHTMFHEMRAPEYKLDLKPKESTKPRNGSPDDEKRWAIQTLWEMGDDKLLPRWRGVLLTSEAELDAKAHEELIGEPKIPWINVKFASINRGGIKVAASENPEYQTLQKLGIACIGEHVNMTQQARFKYHIDLGGGGGTTWTGTIEKLALPGVLFHHVTPTKDWFHDLLVPWTHYIPVKTDLSDLQDKFEWAEEHPIEARKIAGAGTEFARWMGSAEGFAKLYEEYLVAPLREVIRGYRPLPPKYQGKSVMDVINEVGEKEGFSIVGRCSGLHANSCEQLV